MGLPLGRDKVDSLRIKDYSMFSIKQTVLNCILSLDSLFNQSKKSLIVHFKLMNQFKKSTYKNIQGKKGYIRG